ncbi:restriction endonuclease subunit S [Leuconostoc mesenteroides]|uniref:restriction endonuclease subunit S n=1 Tax=Leuconostoc mesenteroides TaxID=1245 RepID=UPI002952BB65|nr:restriction endonuclease subunit S [Leuconostoc mesenteroides]MDV7740360.1 restriction endonuclease subunit S [Leuconostoc mesenteroides]
MSNMVPMIRFRGFTDDWEERKLTDILSRLSKSSNNSELPKIEFEDIVAGEGRLNKDVSHKFDDRKGILFESQNILYGKLRPYLKNWLLADFKGIALGDFWVFKSINSDPKFVYSLIQSNHYQKVANDTSGTKMPRSDWKKVSSTDFPTPSSLEEQQKIGSFFKQLDNTIALHQRILDLLKKQKKGFLQKMFPKNGAKVPELRFEGFTDDWEERKFEDLLDSKDGVRRGPFGSALKKEFFVENSEYVVYEQQNAIYDNYHTRYKITKEKFDELSKFKLNPGDFIMSGAGTIGRISRVPDGVKLGVFNQALIRFRINPEITDSEYFIQFVRADFMQKNLTGANPGSAITNLVPMSEVKKWEIEAPHLEEQKKIGSFFAQLDNTIALHQRKLDLLKEQKKGFLQKMFVS